MDLTKVETVVPKATYKVPTFGVGGNGLEEVGHQIITFVKGSRDDASVPRQNGITTETLISVGIRYLLENNVGDLQNVYTDEALKHLNKALEILQRRAKDRAARGVLGTYKQ